MRATVVTVYELATALGLSHLVLLRPVRDEWQRGTKLSTGHSTPRMALRKCSLPAAFLTGGKCRRWAGP